MKIDNAFYERLERWIKRQKDKRTSRHIAGFALLALFIFASILFIEPKEEKKKAEYRSSKLHLVITEDGNVIRSDYVAEDGKITNAANLGYATVVTTRGDNISTEVYFDDKGEKATRIYQGYHGIQREYDETGNIIRITYLNKAEKPMLFLDGYAIEERDYEEGRFIASRYYNTAYQLVLTPRYGCGRRNEYNVNDQLTRVTYIDENGNPYMTSQGYASYTREIVPKEISGYANTIREMYLDAEGKPAVQALGECGVERVYNNEGLAIRITYLDAKGNKMVTKKGYTTVTCSYHADNHIATEQYYDINGNPFALAEGQYGYRKDGNKVTYLDAEGKELFNIKNIMYSKSWIVVPVTLATMLGLCWTPRKLCIGLAAVYVLVIGYFTVMYREKGDIGVALQVFRDYRMFFSDSGARADIFKNIWLFIPLGALLYRAYPNKLVMLIPVALSILIEGIQFFAKLGLCEIDDVISNGLGGAIGLWGQRGLMLIRDRKKS